MNNGVRYSELAGFRAYSPIPAQWDRILKRTQPANEQTGNLDLTLFADAIRDCQLGSKDYTCTTLAAGYRRQKFIFDILEPAFIRFANYAGLP